MQKVCSSKHSRVLRIVLGEPEKGALYRFTLTELKVQLSPAGLSFFIWYIYIFLPFHARIVLQKKKDKKTPTLILGLCHKLMRKDTPTSVLRTGAKENQLQFFSVHFSQRKDLDHPGKVKSTYRLFLSREGRSNSPRFHA